MINVPERVKDALRSGEYRKNYRIEANVTSVTKSTLVGTKSPAWYGGYEAYVYNIDFSDYAEGATIKITCPYANAYQEVRLFGNSGLPIYIPTTSGNETYVTFPVNSDTRNTNELYFFQFNENAPATFYMEVAEPKALNFDNSNLVAESVKFDERMCSDTELKFGLCEGSSVEFQYFGITNILGWHITVYIDIEYKNENGVIAWHTIPMGQYDVTECSRQASTGIIKVTAYNKLRSDKFDKDVTSELTAMLQTAGSSGMQMYDVLSQLTSGEGISKTSETPINTQVFTKPTVDQYGTYYNLLLCPVTVEYDWQGAITGYTRMTGFRYEIDRQKFVIATETQWNSSNYYRVIIKLNALLSFVNNIYSQWKDTPIWIGQNEGVMSGDANCGTTIDQYIRGNYAYSRVLRGYVELKYTDNTSTYYDVYPNGGINNLGFITNILSDLMNVEGYKGVGVFLYLPILFKTRVIEQELQDPPVIWPATSDDMITVDPAASDVQAATALAISAITNNNSGTANPTLEMSYVVNSTPIESTKIYLSDILSDSNSITLRELQSAVFEINCQYGKLDRVTDLFAGIELNKGRLYPRDDLYPADSLYPLGESEGGYPAMYSKLWADEGNIRTFRYLIITYKGTENGQEVEKKLQRTVNANGTDDYNMSDNWLFKNLVWTDADVGAYADAMVLKMQGISWFPFEMWCAGLPYLESGDEIEIAMQEGAYRSYVLRRTLSGIQNLQDEMINGTLDIF